MAATDVSRLGPIPMTDFYTDAAYGCRVVQIIEMVFSDLSFAHLLQILAGLVFRPLSQGEKSQKA